MDGATEDEVVKFLRATASADRGLDPLQWWKGNEDRFPTISLVARNIMAVQASSVASESAFSISGKLIVGDRGSLSDTSINACMCVNSWRRVLSSAGVSTASCGATTSGAGMN